MCRVPKRPGLRRGDSLQERNKGLYGVRGVLSSVQGKMPRKAVFLRGLRGVARGLLRDYLNPVRRDTFSKISH